jgi:hypothetical protein
MDPRGVGEFSGSISGHGTGDPFTDPGSFPMAPAKPGCRKHQPSPADRCCDIGVKLSGKLMHRLQYLSKLEIVANSMLISLGDNLRCSLLARCMISVIFPFSLPNGGKTGLG